MKLFDYEKLYDAILEMTYDVEESINVFNNTTEEDIEKCKWIAAMIRTMDDVPKRAMECMFKRKKIKFNYIEFMDSVETI